MSEFNNEDFILGNEVAMINKYVSVGEIIQRVSALESICEQFKREADIIQSEENIEKYAEAVEQYFRYLEKLYVSP